MHNHTPRFAAARDTWFALNRHDDPPAPEPEPDPAPEVPPEPDAPPEPADDPPATDGKDWQGEAEKWKALARKHEGVAKANSKAAAKLAEIEDAQKTEAEKLAAAKDAAEAKAAAAINRAVRAEIKALAADDFADPTDADTAVDPTEFVDDAGDINVAGIKAKLAELLEAKPHWRKAAAEPPRAAKPKPDPGQGPRPTQAPANFKEADRATFEAELAKYGVKPRSSA